MKARRMNARLLLALALAGCGAAPGTPPTRMETVVDEAAGTQLVVLPRPTRGRIWLSLWIDAGARDADPPQLATVAAWIAASDEITAEVFPDGIELSRSCRVEELDECLRSLRAAISTRNPSASTVAAARERLAAVRRRARADESRRADALALQALLGQAADPLGDPADDPRVTEQSVGAFLAAHVGAGRLLLVAVGDVEAAAVREKVSALFEELPPAHARRSERLERPGPRVHVDVGDAAIVAAAILRPSIEDAALRARTLVARLDADAPGSHPTADVFPLRGGAAIVARARGDGSALLDHAVEIAEEPPVDRAAMPPPGDGPRALARWIGARWAARHDRPLERRLGVGAILAGGRGDRMGEREPDAALREEGREALEAKLRRRFEPPAGSIHEGSAELELPGGGRIAIRRLEGAEDVSALTLFSGGAAEDAPEAHGTSALLAETAYRGCDLVARKELGSPLDALGIRAEPTLRAHEWGLLLEGPRARWREVAYLATRCVSLPHLNAPELERARDSLLARLERPRESALAAASRALAPGAPGRVAPSGQIATVSRINLSTLRRARGRRVVSSRARIAFAGDVAVDEASRLLTRGASRWPEGFPPEDPPWDAPGERLAAEHHPEGRTEALIGWIVEGEPSDELAARAFARQALHALSAEPGLRARGYDAGTSGGRAWALVVVEASPGALDLLPGHLARALSTVRWSETATDALREAEERLAWAETSPRSVVALLARGDSDPPSASDIEATLLRLRRSQAHYVILRPQPGRHR